MFGKHSSTATEPSDTIVDERTDDVVDEPTAESPEAVNTDRTQRIMTTPKNETVVEEPVATEPVVVEPATVTEPVAEPVAETETPVKTGWAHVSLIATVSLIVGTLAIAATLTGLLAPLGFAAGILAVLLGLIALVAVRRPNVTGHGLMVFGIIFGAVAVVLSMLAMGGQLSWLSNKTDEIATVHNWLNDHMHWLRRW